MSANGVDLITFNLIKKVASSCCTSQEQPFDAALLPNLAYLFATPLPGSRATIFPFAAIQPLPTVQKQTAALAGNQITAV